MAAGKGSSHLPTATNGISGKEDGLKDVLHFLRSSLWTVDNAEDD